EWILLQLLDDGREIPRIDDEYVSPSQPAEQQAVRCQGEDVIEGNRRDQGCLLLEMRPDPRLRLQDVCADVRMSQHGALGDTGRTSGVLQKGKVFGPDVRRIVS